MALLVAANNIFYYAKKTLKPKPLTPSLYVFKNKKCANPGLFFIYFCLFKHIQHILQQIGK